MDNIRLLKHAKELLKKGWTKNVFATDKAGQHVSDFTTGAACFCLIGAVRRAQYDLTSIAPGYNHVALGALAPAFKEDGKGLDTFVRIAEFNDTADSVDTVIAKVDAAIEYWEKQ